LIVSMIQIIIEIPDCTSLKDKRQVVKSLKERIRRKFQVSVAEVDLQDSLSFGQLGAALVSNSSAHGEEVMNKLLKFVEDELPGRVHDVSVYSETF